MRDYALDALLLKVSGGATLTGTILGGFFIGGEALPFFNVSISTLGMAAAGSMIAFAYGTPVESRRKLYGYAIGGTFIGVWTVQLAKWQGIDIPDEFAPPIAGGAALISRWAVPIIIENIPQLWARIFNTGKPPEGGGK